MNITIAQKWRRRTAWSSKDRADPRKQFARIKRLGQIIVGAQIEAIDSLVDAIARRQYDNGKIALMLAKLAQNRKAVSRRQSKIEKHQVVSGSFGRVDGNITVGNPINGVGGVLKGLSHTRPNHTVILRLGSCIRVSLKRRKSGPTL
jgi:hypothetical protein